MKTQDKFNFYVPITIEKAVDKKTGKEEMIFTGVASDDSKDLDGEELIPSGFNFDSFLDTGFINWGHQVKNNPKMIVGEPIQAMVKDNKFIVKGRLYKDSQLAKDIWETAEMLEKSGSTRRLGFSIEGTPLKRSLMNPKRIEKARISGLAITHVPKNKNTIFQLVKGLQEEDYIDYEFEKAENSNGSDSPEFLIDIVDEEKEVRVTMDKSLTIKIEKAITTDTGKDMIKEHLEEKKDKIGEAIITIAKGYEQGLVSEEEKNMVVEVIDKKV